MNNLAQIEYDNTPPPFDDIDIATLKMPPHSLEAEQSVLGGLLMRGELYTDVSEIVSAVDFFQPRHRLIFEAMGKVQNSGDGLDIITVSEALADVDAIGGIGYLMELANNTPSVANIRAYAKVVNTRAMERALIGVGQTIADAGFNTEISLDEKISIAQREVMAIGETEAEAQLYGDDALGEWVHEFDKLCTEGLSFGVPTGFTDIDKRMHGLQASDLILLGGRPAMGKSTLAFQIAANAAINNKPTMIFSLEMSRKQIYNKLMACLGGINADRLRKGALESEDWSKLSAAVQKLKGKPLYIDDRGGLHINQIRSTARRMHRKNPLGLVVVDYLQLVRGDGDNRTGEVGSVSRALKGLAKELDCPVIALTQLNRKLEDRTNKRPHNADLRDSGELEQDADIILFVYRDEVYNENSEAKGVAEVICTKFRNGEIGTDYLHSDLTHSRFADMAHGYVPPVYEGKPDRKSKSTGMDY